MTAVKRKLALAVALLLPITLLSGCMSNPTIANVPPGPDATITKVAISLLDIARITGTLQNSVITANTQGLMSVDNTQRVLTICGKINTFVSQASAITRGQANLPPAERSKLAGLVNPIIQTFAQDMNAGLLGINDQKTKDIISAELLTIQTTLTSIQVFASGGN